MRNVTVLVIAAVASTVAAAQAPPDPLELCAQKSEATARLACFDHEMQRRHETSGDRGASREVRAPAAAPAAAAPIPATAPAATETPPAAAGDQATKVPATTSGPGAAAAASAAAATAASTSSPNAAASHAEENVGLEGAQLRKKLREEGVVEESHKPKPIVAQVSRALEHPDHRYTFVLDNGQVWEQVENKPGVFVDAHESVTITPGVLGSFFLRTSKKLYLRVRRVE